MRLPGDFLAADFYIRLIPSFLSLTFLLKIFIIN